MSNTEEKTGQYQMATSLIVTISIIYLYDVIITNSNLNEQKKLKVVFLLLTMLIFTNVTVWFSGLKPIDESVAVTGTNADDATALVTEGIPYLTEGRLHSAHSGHVIEVGSDGTPTKKRILATTSNSSGQVIGEPINDAYRHMYHLLASTVGGGLLTGIYMFFKGNFK